jgi:hypothetical protein
MAMLQLEQGEGGDAQKIAAELKREREKDLVFGMSPQRICNCSISTSNITSSYKSKNGRRRSTRARKAASNIYKDMREDIRQVLLEGEDEQEVAAAIVEDNESGTDLESDAFESDDEELQAEDISTQVHKADGPRPRGRYVEYVRVIEYVRVYGDDAAATTGKTSKRVLCGDGVATRSKRKAIATAGVDARQGAAFDLDEMTN